MDFRDGVVFVVFTENSKIYFCSVEMAVNFHTSAGQFSVRFLSYNDSLKFQFPLLLPEYNSSDVPLQFYILNSEMNQFSLVHQRLAASKL